MKRILLLLLSVLTIAACSKKPTPDPIKKLNPFARIQLNLEESATKTKNGNIPGTWVADSAAFMSRWGLEWQSKSFRGTFGINEDDYYLQYRDTINNKLFMSGWKIIKEDGTLNLKDGIFSETCIDNVLTIQRYTDTMYPVFPKDVSWKDQITDTIAYIPNKVFHQAQQATIDAYNAGDVDKCYDVFMEYFHFIPITGEKWRALKAAGIE